MAHNNSVQPTSKNCAFFAVASLTRRSRRALRELGPAEPGLLTQALEVRRQMAFVGMVNKLKEWCIGDVTFPQSRTTCSKSSGPIASVTNPGLLPNGRTCCLIGSWPQRNRTGCGRRAPNNVFSFFWKCFQNAVPICRTIWLHFVTPWGARLGWKYPYPPSRAIYKVVGNRSSSVVDYATAINAGSSQSGQAFSRLTPSRASAIQM